MQNILIEVGDILNVLLCADLIWSKIMGNLIPHPSEVLQFFIELVPFRNCRSAISGLRLHILNVMTDTIWARVHIRAESVKSFIRLKEIIV